MHTLTQKHKETLVRGSYCAPLWQYYVWARRTLICLLWREVHFSAIFSPLELELEWSPPPSILPATTHPLIVSAAAPNEGPQGPMHSHQGGFRCCMQAFMSASGRCSCSILYCQRGKIFTCLRIKLLWTAKSRKDKKGQGEELSLLLEQNTAEIKVYCTSVIVILQDRSSELHYYFMIIQ